MPATRLRYVNAVVGGWPRNSLQSREGEFHARRPSAWIVIADGSRARIVVRREDGTGLDIVSEAASDEAHTPSREIWSDRPGKTQESGYPGHHGIEPRHDPHDERKAAFVRGLAGQPNQAAAEKRFDSLIAFAPPRCLGELRGALDDAARRRIKATAPKDLAKLPLGELPRHLEELGQD